MATRKNGQYRLFDEDTRQPDENAGIDTPPKQEPAPEQEPGQQGTPPGTGNVSINELETLFKFAQKMGMYFPLGGDGIMRRCRAYYFDMIGDVEKYLNASGLTQETITAVKRDYIIALCGYFNFTATPNQMAETLEHLKPGRVFLIDRYGLYRLLLIQYYKIARVVFDYVESVKDSDPETKQRYIETFQPDNLRAAAWAMQRGVIKLFDFEGVPAQTVATFADTVRYISELSDYGNFYHLCKYAYKATPEELETITPPEALKHAHEQGFTDFLNDFCKQCEQGLSNAAAMYAEAMETPNPDIGRWNPNGVKLSANLTTIQQKPIEVHTKYKTDPISIRTFIKEFPLKHKDVEYSGLVTEQTINTVIAGLDAIRSWGKFSKVKPENNILRYEFSMEDFTKICGYKDANQNDRLALLFGLQILNNLYVRCDRPVRVARPGKKPKYNIGGWLQIFTLRYYSDDLSSLVIEIFVDDLGGELTLCPPGIYEKLNGGNMGLSERRFIKQILGKDNKKEEDLVSECFGYADMLKWAEPQDVKDVKTYIRKNKARDRKKVQGWFDKYKEMGVIKDYTRTQNKAGEWVYRWKRGDTSKVEGIAETNPANLITDAEILDAEQGTGASQPEQ